MSAMLRQSSAARPPLPPALPGFEEVYRYWDNGQSSYIAKIAPGEYYVTKENELIATVLGSCISACVRDRRLNVGGMNHFMLPMDGLSASRGEDTCISSALRYGNFAMEHLFNELYSRGSRRIDLEVKVFGGGHVMRSSVRVGDKNIAFVHEFLETEGHAIDRKDVGGNHGRKLLYNPTSGRALVKAIRSSEVQSVAEREAQYVEQLNKKPVVGEVELF